MKRFLWLYPAAGLVIGLSAWNSNPANMPVALLLLPAWYYAKNRFIAFLTVFFYFAAASHGLPVGTMTYLQANFFNASFTWLAGVLLVSLSFLLFFNNKKLRIIGLYIALIAVAIPPFGLTCRTHPLASIGMWWPGGGWLALAAVLLLIPAFCRWPVLPAVPVLLALFLSYYPVATPSDRAHWFGNPVVPLQGHRLAFFVCNEQFFSGRSRNLSGISRTCSVPQAMSGGLQALISLISSIILWLHSYFPCRY